jgi:hypothetical protein
MMDVPLPQAKPVAASAMGRDPDFRVIGSNWLMSRLVLGGNRHAEGSRFCPA